MIKAAAQMSDGTPMLILGLSRDNCDRLLRNQPISVDVGELYEQGAKRAGFPQRMIVMVVGGETDGAMADAVYAKVQVGADERLQPESDDPHIPVVALLGRIRALAHRRRDEELLALLGEA